jgi:hypothetical protein
MQQATAFLVDSAERLFLRVSAVNDPNRWIFKKEIQELSGTPEWENLEKLMAKVTAVLTGVPPANGTDGMEEAIAEAMTLVEGAFLVSQARMEIENLTAEIAAMEKMNDGTARLDLPEAGKAVLAASSRMIDLFTEELRAKRNDPAAIQELLDRVRSFRSNICSLQDRQLFSKSPWSSVSLPRRLLATYRWKLVRWINAHKSFLDLIETVCSYR